jgi:Dihydrodipicolinate synthase/N-acetylneuraminate lyase
MKKTYSGVVVPMVTPITKELKIDTAAVSRIVKLFAENGISPLIMGTTGESSSISLEQSKIFLQTAVQAKGKDQMIYAGLVGNNVAELLERAKIYAALGADVVVSTLPSYYILTPEQMELYYTQLADASPCPIMMYNIKATTQMSIPPATVERLSHHPNIVGLKDSERDEERLLYFIKKFKNRSDFSFFCGWGAQSLGSLLLGADGVVPSTGNIVPEMYKKLYDAFLENNYTEAEKWQIATDEVAKTYQQDRTLGQSLAALKALMAEKELCETFMLPPLN